MVHLRPTDNMLLLSEFSVLFYTLLLFAAICDPPCENNGNCSRPQYCECPQGYDGYDCGERLAGELCDHSLSCMSTWSI